jgi:hypothetical protein
MKIARDDDPEGAAELARAYDREQQAARRRRKAEEAAVTITASLKPARAVERPVLRLVGGAPTDNQSQDQPAEVRLVYDLVEQALDLVARMTAEEFAEFYSRLDEPSSRNEVSRRH